MLFKNKFSLIELIVVISILGILAVIIIPNISNVKENAIAVRVKADQTQFQKAVDMYRLDHNGEIPTEKKPELGKPVYLDVTQLSPHYVLPSMNKSDIKYWIDSDGTVWAARVDSPINIRIEGNQLKWDEVEGSTLYYVYEKKTSTTGHVNVASMNFVGEVTGNTLEVNPAKTYFVSAVDVNGHQSPPTTTGYEREIPKTPGGGNQDWIAVSKEHTDFQYDLKLKWEDVTYDSHIPEGTKVVISYQTSDDGVNWSEAVKNIADAAPSYHLRVNVEYQRLSTVSEVPSIQNIQVKQEVVWRSLGSSELLFSGTNAKWTSVTYTTNVPTDTRMTVTYQTSNDQIVWTPSSTDVTTLAAGKFLKVTVNKESLSSTTTVPTISNIQVKQGTTTQNTIKKFNEKINYASYEKILYVDDAIGLDTNNGSLSHPLKTFDKAYQVVTSGIKTLIVLNDGSYTASTSIYNKQDVDVIGKNQNTHLIFNAPYGRPDPSGNGYVVFQKDMSFYNMIIETRGTATYANYFYVHGGHVAFYNVVFDNFFDLDYTDFITYNNSGTYFFNTTTTASGHKNFTLRSEGNASLNVIQNAYGYIQLDTTYGYAIDPSLLKDSKISTSPKLDSSFNITESGWQNIGLGNNPDGSRASAGVYGGPNAWQ